MASFEIALQLAFVRAQTDSGSKMRRVKNADTSTFSVNHYNYSVARVPECLHFIQSFFRFSAKIIIALHIRMGGEKCPKRKALKLNYPLWYYGIMPIAYCVISRVR